MAREQCASCRFWCDDLETMSAAGKDLGEWGACRRRPPNLSEAMVRAEMPRPEYGHVVDLELSMVSLAIASLFPATAATGWCGEYRADGSEAPLC